MNPVGISAGMPLEIDARMLRFRTRITAIPVLVSTHSVLVAGTVRIPITSRIRVPTSIAIVRVGASVAVAAIVAGWVVRVTWAAAETTCGECCGQDPSQQQYYLSRVNRFHSIPLEPSFPAI